jgi:hypothetical protein
MGTTLRRFVGLAAAAALAPMVQAAVVWDESLAGDLSNLGSAPTSVAIANGSNQILGTTGAPDFNLDADYFSVIVPAGHALTSLTLLPGTMPVDDIVAFLGIQAGDKVTAVFDPAPLLGWIHYSSSNVGTNLLPVMGTAPGAIGFIGPLGPGQYSFWVQDYDFGVSVYGIELTVAAAVPEPQSVTMLTAGLIAVGLMLRRAGRRTLPR